MNDPVAAPARLHTLYRFFNHEGRLLYVGITCNPGRRLREHGRDRPWWTEVARVHLEQHASREDLMVAERDAIAFENPVYNIARAHRKTVVVDEPPTDYPAVLDAYTVSKGSWQIWCAWCEQWHTHGAGPGHRVAHCACAKSPYKNSGYFLVPTNEKRPARRQARGYMCGGACWNCPEDRKKRQR